MIEILTTAEVAALNGVQPATVRLWVREGRISAIKTPGGRDYRFTWQALRDAWNARERTGTDGNNPGGGPAGDPEPAPTEPDTRASAPAPGLAPGGPAYDHEHPCPAECRPGVWCCICADREAAG